MSKRTIIKEELNLNFNAITTNTKLNVDNAHRILANVKLTEKEKISSGNYEWVTVQPKVGGSYKTLKRKNHA